MDNTSQAQELDSLKKYTYHILGSVATANYTYFENGSGFFFRTGNRLLFITARHVFSGCVNEKIKKSFFPNIMNIKIPVKNKSKAVLYPINARKYYKSIACDSINSQPDLIAIEVDKRLLANVHSVETFCVPSFDGIGDIQFFGFPGGGINGGINNPLLRQISTVYIAGPNEIITDTRKPFKVMIMLKERITNLDGFSGAPVFAKETDSGRIILSGVFAGSSTSDNPYKYLTVMKTEFLVKEIEMLCP